MAKKSHEVKAAEPKQPPIYDPSPPTASNMEQRVRNLESQVEALAPLREILNQVAQIKRYFGG